MPAQHVCPHCSYHIISNCYYLPSACTPSMWLSCHRSTWVPEGLPILAPTYPCRGTTGCTPAMGTPMTRSHVTHCHHALLLQKTTMFAYLQAGRTAVEYFQGLAEVITLSWTSMSSATKAKTTKLSMFTCWNQHCI